KPSGRVEWTNRKGVKTMLMSQSPSKRCRGEARGIGLNQGGADLPDGDVVEIQPVAVPGVQRLDEEVTLCNVEHQHLGRGGGGFGSCGHGEASDPGVSS